MADEKPGLRSSTEVLTRGFDPRLSVGSARPAVFRSSTYVFSSPEAAERAFDLVAGRAKPQPGEQPDLIYSRFNHPNAEIFESQIVPLENGARAAIVFNSGMAAITTALFTFLRPGDAILYTVPIYGGTQSLIEGFLESWGVSGIAIQAGETAAIADAIRTTPNLRVILIETPANPTLTMTDILSASRAGTEAGSARSGEPPMLMVDNTLLGPTFQHPLDHGAHLVLYSATKYLSGFSDLIGGVALASDPELVRKMRLKRNMFGNILQPDECWMLASRLPTVRLADEPAEQERAAHRRAAGVAPEGPQDVLPVAVRGSRTRSAFARRSAISPARCFRSSFTAASLRRSIFCGGSAWLTMPCRWVVWRRWCAIPRPRRIPASPRSSRPRQA